MFDEFNTGKSGENYIKYRVKKNQSVLIVKKVTRGGMDFF